MNSNQPNQDNDNSGGDRRQQRDRRDDAALLEYYQLTKKWAASNDELQAAFREPSTLSLRESMDQLVREIKLAQAMYADAIEFIGRLLGTGSPFSVAGDPEGRDIQP